MCELIIHHDTFSQQRQRVALLPGAWLADELMRLFPEGLEGAWSLYAQQVCEEGLLAQMPATRSEPDQLQRLLTQRVVAGDCYVLVRRAGTTAEFWIQFAISVLLSAAVSLLTPRPRRPQLSEQEARDSGNNALAGQTNVLRPGARVPEILGRVRSFPDLLTFPLEEWSGQEQYLEQFFVVGVGHYDIAEPKLGDTPFSFVPGADYKPYLPGDPLPVLRVVNTAPEINSMSLMVEDTGQTPAQGTEFSVSLMRMSTQTKLPTAVGDMLKITDTGTTNNGYSLVTSAPDASQTAPPFLYGLDRVGEDQINVNATVEVFTLFQTWPAVPATGDNQFWPNFGAGLYDDTAQINARAAVSREESEAIQAGWVVDIVPSAHPRVRGVIPLWSWTGSYGTPFKPLYEFYVQRIDGTYYDFPPPPGYVDPSTFKFFKPSSSSGTGSTPAGPIKPASTTWYRAPLDDFDEVRLDITFPQGLVIYNNGLRQTAAVELRIEFRRPGVIDAQAIDEPDFLGDTSGPLRYTLTYTTDRLATLGLPAGTGLEVRVTRLTVITPDTATLQSITETRWHSFSAIRSLSGQAYPDVTIVKLNLRNKRAAVSIGETSFNVVATRKQFQWTPGSGWSATRVATRKWADHFIARCSASDGANLLDAFIDLAGIYALQQQLDAMDGGKQGEISMTLDQLQDIDTELTQIADVVRASVYRVGRKIFVVRDQATSLRVALFNGRAKASQAESVAMRMKSSDEHDAVVVSWVDEASGWKGREYQFPEGAGKTNILRVGVQCANWQQAWRRARFEWFRLIYRRQQITVSVTEDGRICRPGDVVNITDDLANLALAAGEVLYISGNVLTLDHRVDFTQPGSYVLLVRDTKGVNVDAVPVVVADTAISNKVQLTRAPIAGVELKGRDEAMGTLYAFFHESAAAVHPWLLTAVELDGPWVRLTGVNYSASVYQGDSGAVDPAPPLPSRSLEPARLPLIEVIA